MSDAAWRASSMNARILVGAGLTEVCTANTEIRGQLASSTGASSPDATGPRAGDPVVVDPDAGRHLDHDVAAARNLLRHGIEVQLAASDPARAREAAAALGGGARAVDLAGQAG